MGCIFVQHMLSLKELSLGQHLGPFSSLVSEADEETLIWPLNRYVEYQNTDIQGPMEVITGE